MHTTLLDTQRQFSRLVLVERRRKSDPSLELGKQNYKFTQKVLKAPNEVLPGNSCIGPLENKL